MHPPPPAPVLLLSFRCIPFRWILTFEVLRPHFTFRRVSVCLFLLQLGVSAPSEAYQCSLRTGIQKDLIMVTVNPPPTPPPPPPLLECWLFYQHPNVELWSNSLCVPNIASGRGGDVFMTHTLIAACRKSARMRGMVCISCTFPTGPRSALLARSCALEWVKRETVKTARALSPPLRVEQESRAFMS